MLDAHIYHPRLLKFKDPFGAVPLGTQVRFFAGLPLHATDCTLCIHREFAGETESLPMERTADGFSFVYTAPAEPELVWYHFSFHFEDGGSNQYGTDGFPRDDAPVSPFQLTVYDESLATPDWFRDGITYQIFPDRFCRLELPQKVDEMIGNRWVHEYWGEDMVFLPENGVVTNRDFFGGSLKGILARLDYLESLSVSTIYLNPIFEAASNHRYDTCDYKKIDPMLGTEEDFRALCSEAKKRGMRIILDGVFNHTGDGSRYFNARGWYDTVGAAQSKDSPWYDWYDFTHWPDDYSSWWGIKTLPQVQESHPDYINYIIEDEDSVVRRWLRAGASGWRLDVADELPDSFIEKLRAAATEEKEDAIIIGEVWEDGSNKVAYNERRKYLLGKETHGLMNYPFRVAAIAWLQGGDAADFMEAMETIREHYPAPAFYSSMNSLGTHDNPRILTLCGQTENLECYSKEWRSRYKLGYIERQRAIRRLKLASTLLYAFPGSPSVYYGDEIGMEGCEDPFNRATFPWGNEDEALLSHYRLLGKLRASRVSMKKGDIRYHFARGGVLSFSRTWENEVTAVALNNSWNTEEVTIPWKSSSAIDVFTRQTFSVYNGELHITLPPENGMLLIEL